MSLLKVNDMGAVAQGAVDKVGRFRAQQLARWEVVLALFLLADFALNAMISPYFLYPWTLSDVTFNFTEKAIVALPMALLIIVREIDISVSGIIALVSVAVGLVAQHGVGTPALVAIGLATGIAAGAVNGVLVTLLRVPSIVATIGTMSLFRGVAYGVLGDTVLKAYPQSFAFWGQGYVAGPVSFEFVLFVVLAALCGVYLHQTVFGKRLYAIGANPVAAAHSGIRPARYRFWLFVATGAASALASILLTSRLGSTRPSIAKGWELEIISMVILGGVSIAGGRGTIIGVVLAAALMGLVTFGLGLQNIPGIVMSIVIGSLLILVAAIPTIGRRLANRRHQQTQKDNHAPR
jgi:rhamnose transport system permease protein